MGVHEYSSGVTVRRELQNEYTIFNKAIKSASPRNPDVDCELNMNVRRSQVCLYLLEYHDISGSKRNFNKQ